MMRVVVKLGGSLLTDPGLLHRIVGQFVEIQNRHHEVILVHGGSRQIGHYLDRLQIPSQFHNGLRVTDSASMQVVQMVLAGLVNKNIVAAFAERGRPAVGLCGGDGNSFVARKYSDGQAGAKPVDYGFVGEVFRGDPKLINLLLLEKYVPVIACIAIGEDAAYYNVNADEMASAVAIFCQAQRLVFLTDVPGVLDTHKRVIPSLFCSQLNELRSSGVISEGMLPKTRACERALESGIQTVHIVGGKEPDCLTRILLNKESLGTAIC